VERTFSSNKEVVDIAIASVNNKFHFSEKRKKKKAKKRKGDDRADRAVTVLGRSHFSPAHPLLYFFNIKRKNKRRLS
jgi:hypothetical protein